MKCCRTYGLNKRSLYKEEVIRPSAPRSRHRPGQKGHRNRNLGVWGTLLPLPFRSFSLAFLANRSRRGLTLKSRTKGRRSQGTRDHRRGCKPPVMLQRQRKPRGGDRELSKLLSNMLDILSPLQGLVLLTHLFRGFSPPSVVFRTFGAFPRTPIKQKSLTCNFHQLFLLWES